MENKLKKYRRDLHKIPELSLEEYKTSAYLKAQLEAFGLNTFSLLETDVLVFIDKKSEKTIAFRSDIDALPIIEDSNVDFASTHEGFMHACGHDGHMAMLLGFAEYLSKNIEKLQQNVLLIFQPAEETVGGGRLLVEKGLLQKYNVEKIFGIHLYPEIPQGYLASRPGKFMAMASEVTIKVHGKTAHGAMPQLGIDANMIAAKFMLECQTIQTRQISPLEETIITFGKFGGGSVRNIVSDLAYLEGTIRTFNKDVLYFIKDQIHLIATSYEQRYGCKIEVDISGGYLPVINDLDLYETFRTATKDFKYFEFEQPLMVAEDFSFYQEQVPGIFFYVGIRNEQLGHIHSLHNSQFNFDENALMIGFSAYVAILKELGALNE